MQTNERVELLHWTSSKLSNLYNVTADIVDYFVSNVLIDFKPKNRLENRSNVWQLAGLKKQLEQWSWELVENAEVQSKEDWEKENRSMCNRLSEVVLAV